MNYYLINSTCSQFSQRVNPGGDLFAENKSDFHLASAFMQVLSLWHVVLRLADLLGDLDAQPYPLPFAHCWSSHVSYPHGLWWCECLPCPRDSGLHREAGSLSPPQNHCHLSHLALCLRGSLPICGLCCWQRGQGLDLILGGDEERDGLVFSPPFPAPSPGNFRPQLSPPPAFSVSCSRVYMQLGFPQPVFPSPDISRYTRTLTVHTAQAHAGISGL